VEDEEGKRRSYRLVGPDEFEAGAGLISVEAPLGRALLGRREGDEVVVMRPAGRLLVTVMKVAWSAPGD
jgi:transcription elongation factor GreB